MLACFLIISQVVVIKTEPKKKKKTWAEFHLMTVWVMKINSRRIQAQPALTSCTEMEEGWRAWGPPDFPWAMSPACRVWGVGWGREAGCELSPFQFSGERQRVVSHQGSRQICLKRVTSHLLHPFHLPDTSHKIFSCGPILPSFPLKPTVQGLSNQEHLWVPLWSTMSNRRC